MPRPPDSPTGVGLDADRQTSHWLTVHLFSASLLLLSSILRPCYLSLAYGLIGLWLVSGGRWTPAVEVGCGGSAALGMVVSFSAQVIAAAAPSSLEGVFAGQMLLDAVAFVPWQRADPDRAVLQLLSDPMVLLAVFMLRLARKSSRNRTAGQRLGLVCDRRTDTRSWHGATPQSLFQAGCCCSLLAFSTTLRTLLHLPYFILALTSVQVWASRGNEGWIVSRPICIATLLYATAHMTSDYLLHIPSVGDTAFLHSTTAQWIGLKPLEQNSVELWLGSALRLCLFMLFGSTGWSASAFDEAEAFLVTSQSSSRQLARDRYTGGQGGLAERLLPQGAAGLRSESPMLSALIRSTSKLLITVCTLTWAVSVHSVPSVPILLSAFAMKFLHFRAACAVARYVLGYGALFMTAQYVYDVLYVAPQRHDDNFLATTGLQPLDRFGARLALQFLLALPLAIAGRVGSREDDTGDAMNPGASICVDDDVVSSGVGDPAAGAPNLKDEQDIGAEASDNISTKISIFCGHVLAFMWQCGTFCLSIVKLVFGQLDMMCLLLLYVAALAKIDVLHSGYVAFCLLLLLFPQVSKTAWVLFLFYCEFVVFGIYMWQFTWVGEGSSNNHVFVLLGFHYNGNCTDIGGSEDVLNGYFIVRCWDVIGLPSLMVVVVATVQLSIFASISSALPTSSVKGSHNNLRKKDSQRWKVKLIWSLGWLSARFGHYLATVGLILVVSLGPSTYMHGVLVLAACILLILAQFGGTRKCGWGSVLLLYLTATFLAIIIMAKYVYKFEQIQKLVDKQDFAPRRELLQDIGFSVKRSVYSDILPDTLLLVFLVSILRLHQSFTGIGSSSQGRFREDTSSVQTWADIVWLWIYEQAQLADFISAATFFTIGCSGVSLVNAGYFIVGVVGCCFRTLPKTVWFVAFMFITLHLLATYAMQFQTIGSGFACQSGPDPDQRWECCALWAGVNEHGDRNTPLWWPFLALLALDVHKRFHSSSTAVHETLAASIAEFRDTKQRVDPSSSLGSISDMDQLSSREARRGGSAAPLVRDSSITPEEPEPEQQSFAFSDLRVDSNAIKVAQWLRVHLTLASVGLEVLYLVLISATIVNANAMSVFYTLHLFICVATQSSRSSRLWASFSVALGLLLVLRYAIYLGMPPCQGLRLPFRKWDVNYRMWLGLGNNCVATNQRGYTFTHCSIFDLMFDCYVLFASTTFTRICALSSLPPSSSSPPSLQRKSAQYSEGNNAVQYGVTWVSHIQMLFWDVGAVSLLLLALVFTSYLHFNLLLLGYLVIGILMLHRQIKLVQGTTEIQALMVYSGLSLLMQAAFQCPAFPAGASDDESSWQRILGFHKVTERRIDLQIGAFAFLIAIALRSTVSSHVYQRFVLPRAARLYGAEADRCHQQCLDNQAANVMEQDRREKAAKLAQEGAKERLCRSDKTRYTPTEPMDIHQDLDTEVDRDPSSKLGLSDNGANNVEIISGEAVGRELHSTDEGDSKTDEQSNSLASISNKWFCGTVVWLYSKSDPLVHPLPHALAAVAGSSSSQSSSQVTDIDVDQHTAELQSKSSALRDAENGVSEHSLLLCQAIWCATYNHSLQICCALMSVNFLIHADIPSSLFPLALFGVCLLIGHDTQASFWRVSTLCIMVRLVIVKFINAWPSWNVLDTDLTGGFGVLLDLDSWEWDMALFLALLVHREHLMRRGEWVSRRTDISCMQQLMLTPLAKGLADRRGNRSRNSNAANFQQFGNDGNEQQLSCGVDLYVWQLFYQIVALCLAPMLYADLFSKGNIAELSAQVESNEIAAGLVVLVFFQFLLILADYAIYLLRSIRTKQVLQWVGLLIYVSLYHLRLQLVQCMLAKLTVGISYWLRSYYAANFAYFYISARQIGHGYPRVQELSSNHRLTHSTGALNSGCLAALRAIPFFIEIVYLVEWLCTPTTLALYDYIRVEEIYVMLYQGQVYIDGLAKETRKKGEVQPLRWTKLIYGMGSIAFLVLVLWAPLFIFSTANPFTTVQNDVQQVQLSISVRVDAASGTGGDVGVYQLFTATSGVIESLSTLPLDVGDQYLSSLDAGFRRELSEFLNQRERLQRVFASHNAQTGWQLNTPARRMLEQALSVGNTTQTELQLQYTFRRADNTSHPEASGASPWTLLSADQTKAIYEMISRKCPGAPEEPCPASDPIRVGSLYPLYLRLGEQGSMRRVGEQMVDLELNHNITFQERFGTVSVDEWWSAKANRTKGAYDAPDNAGLCFVLINDKLATTALASSVLSLGLVGFYVVGVMALGRILRGNLMSIVKDALYARPDVVAPLMQLCSDIFESRFLGLFAVEEELHSELRDIFRSPERLHAYTTKREKLD